MCKWLEIGGEVVVMSGKEVEKEAAHKITIVGEVELISRDKNGRIVDRRKMKNIVVNKGKELMAKLLNGLSNKYFKYIQIGTGTTAPSSSDTALESFYAEKEAACSYQPNFKAIFSATFTFGETVTISESGVFNDAKAASPDMLCRQTFAGKTYTSGESLEVVWTITIS